jgi:hypothetical protein
VLARTAARTIAVPHFVAQNPLHRKRSADHAVLAAAGCDSVFGWREAFPVVDRARRMHN